MMNALAAGGRSLIVRAGDATEGVNCELVPQDGSSIVH